MWRAQLGVIEGLMSGNADSALARESTMAMQFRELDALNTNLAQQAQFLIETQNDALAKRIENARRRLMREVVAASVLAVSLALAFGIWLARPFKRLEHAIVGLGQNRLDEPIDIRGPADVRRVSQQLEWLRLRLTELDADKARFLRHVSHELKTPLAALREGVSLLEDGVTGPLNPAQLEVAQILQQNTVALQGQIEALLRFNAAAFEARELRRERTELLPLIEEQIEAQRLQWQSHGLRVRAEGQPIAITVDRTKLGTAIANLLSNAIRFSVTGGVITLAVSGTPEAVLHRRGRRRAGHCRGRPRPDLRTLLPRRAPARAHGERHRHRTFDRAGVHCSPRGPHHPAAWWTRCTLSHRAAAHGLTARPPSPVFQHRFTASRLLVLFFDPCLSRSSAVPPSPGR
jgi:two-component system sensor histidine kinase GlrK